MRLVNIRLSDIRAAQPEWFSRKNKRLFGDLSYKLLRGKLTHNPYLVRATHAWTDMFGQAPQLHYRINRVNTDTLHVEKLIDTVFRDIDAVKEWLAHN